MKFKTKKELVNWLNSIGKFDITSQGNYYMTGYYSLSYGEYERPEYKPTRYKDGWSLKGIYFYYQNTFYTPVDGRVPDNFYSDLVG